MLQRIIGALFSTSRVHKGAGLPSKIRCVLARRVASQVAALLLVAPGSPASSPPEVRPGVRDKRFPGPGFTSRFYGERTIPNLSYLVVFTPLSKRTYERGVVP